MGPAALALQTSRDVLRLGYYQAVCHQPVWSFLFLGCDVKKSQQRQRNNKRLEVNPGSIREALEGKQTTAGPCKVPASANLGS